MLAYLKFRTQRQLRRFRREVRAARLATVVYINKHVWGKWHQLSIVRPFLLVWWTVIIICGLGLLRQTNTLGNATLVPMPLPGGVYVEAEVGSVPTINPILPQSDASSDVASLIFNGLTRFGPRRSIEPALATSWGVSPDGKTYTFHLRHNVKWQDGVPFTSQDVLFTLAAIQNPDSLSPLASSWQGVTANATDPYTVQFILPSPYVPFMTYTTVGILPAHLLENTDPSALRSADFNQNPVGTGPFMVKSYDASSKEIDLVANPHYFGGKPLLDGFDFRWYDTPSQATAALTEHQVTAVGDVPADQLSAVESIPGAQLHNLSLPNETMVFFNTIHGLLQDKAIRQALAMAVSRGQVVDSLDGQATPITTPILPGQAGYSSSLGQTENLVSAKATLENDGWQVGPGGIRRKDGKRLTFTIVTQAQSNYSTTAQDLKQEWRKLGVDLQIQAVDLTTLQQSFIRPRDFDALLYGIEIGSDPDVYAFWDSSQTKDPGLNLSGYSSPTADEALETGRVNANPEIRAGKYQVFETNWRDDAPGVAITSPLYTYATLPDVWGVSSSEIVQPSDRFNNVVHWMINYRLVPRSSYQVATR